MADDGGVPERARTGVPAEGRTGSVVELAAAGPVTTLDAAAVRRWSRAAVEVLVARRAEIDALNVFPVPDNDTGHNMLVTFRAADAALDAALESALEASAASAFSALSDGAARGAIGNSGFLLSQILRGLAEAAPPESASDTDAVVAGLQAGARLARAAVVAPVEGTLLSIAEAAAAAAAATLDTTGGDALLSDVLAAAVGAADDALQRTTSQLAELEDAGVVDAGGLGLLLVLAALAGSVGADVPPLTAVQLPDRPLAVSAGDPPGDGVDNGLEDRLEDGLVDGYEVQYLLDAPDAAVRRLRHRLDDLGSSVAVVGTGQQAWKVHVHVSEVGPAIEAGLNAGRLRDITVVRLGERLPLEPVRPPQPVRVVVAVVTGRGLSALLQREGVVLAEVPAAAGTATPQLVVDRVPEHCDEVVLLVGDSLAPAADEAADTLRRRGVRVSVVPVRSPVQALAAVAVHDAARTFDETVVAMAEAAGAARYAEVVPARTAALTAVGLCQPGDVLGLIDGEVVQIGHGVLAVALGLVDRLLGIGAELVTVLVGADAPPRAGEVLEAHVRDRSPLTDVAVYPAADLEPALVIGAE